ncbi:MAG: bifunctional phosphoglucose/phosphomannose isomerase [Dehalococcoidales bacterium]|nr:bifunctional phosphoglucose/phosphomannose isomerase [Dehalococcoidales bacterium]
MSTNLDDPKLYSRYDPGEMLARIHEVPRICQQAWQMAMAFDLPEDYSRIDRVVVLGMGGSAIGGDLAASLVAHEAKLPIIVNRQYQLPAFVDDRTLVIASSYSGNTEETLSSFGQALKTGARKLAITTGGKLKETAKENGVPLFIFDYQAQPRAALAFSLLPILAFMQKLGITGDKSAGVAEMVEVLDKLAQEINETVPAAENRAKKLAGELYGRMPIIYGGGITAEVAHRWKTQLNENSKAWAFYEAFSELNHNAVVGYQFPIELAPSVVVVMLRSSYLSERLIRRYQITARLLEQAGVRHHFEDGAGKSSLAQMMSLVLIGDYVSYYLAILNQTDPSPVKTIDFLKAELGKSQP